jgi:hypothetical protein
LIRSILFKVANNDLGQTELHVHNVVHQQFDNISVILIKGSSNDLYLICSCILVLLQVSGLLLLLALELIVLGVHLLFNHGQLLLCLELGIFDLAALFFLCVLYDLVCNFLTFEK